MVEPAATEDNAASASPAPLGQRLLRSTFACAAIGSILLWLAQPPVAWGWLAWLAPTPWLAVAKRDPQLRFGGYAQLWLAGVLYWLLAVHWVRLPHPLTPIGWVCLAAYLGCYLPAFVWLCRVATRRRWAPLWVAAPVAWTGLELLQAHLFSGFLMGALSHTQVDWLDLIQIADTLGAYGVSFVVMLVSTVLFELGWYASQSEWQRVPNLGLATGLAVCIATLLYGVRHSDTQSDLPTISLTVAIIQGNTLATWDPAPDRNQRIMDRQVALTREAAQAAQKQQKQLDLILWPESMFRPPVEQVEGKFERVGNLPEHVGSGIANLKTWGQGLATEFSAPFLVGTDRFDWKPTDDAPDGWDYGVYNSSALINRRGEVAAVYDKTHRVPFGEYIPLASNLPAMYYLTPMSGGLRPGDGPVAMSITTTTGESVTLSPNICYETVIPHVIRRQVKELTDAVTPPDLLVNLTNDAWFWGSSELDMHLACDIFRAVETRTPMVVAANGGLSAVIDSRGRVRALSERMTEQAMVVDVPLDGRSPSRYTGYGDWFARGCLIVCGLLAIIGLTKSEGGRRKADE